jgi:pimeloyl-ACP methyl ester carboxylesterase
MFQLRQARAFLAPCVALAALALTLPVSAADEKETWDRATFTTGDGVKIVGKLYQAQNKDRKAVVVLLHDFSAKGGNSKGNGWQDLALTLQKDGFAVLSFDFRGYGDSTEVLPETFWAKKQHLPGAGTLKKATKKGTTINYQQFNPSYYPYLLNDLAAARTYLEQRNDAKVLNCSNIILVGAGEGATIGSAWLYHETRRRRDKTGKLLFLKGGASGAEPEIRDVAGAVWLSLSPTLAGRGTAVGINTQKWLVEAGKFHKVPLAFFNGNGALDEGSRTHCGKMLPLIKQVGSKGPPPKDGKAIDKEKDTMKLTLQEVKTANLAREKLLDENLETLTQIRNYANAVMEERSKDWDKRGEPDKQRTFYTQARKDAIIKIAKDFGIETPEVDIGIVTGKD